MYSIGRFISNFRDFYNDINGATLTGAIDVVVVQQPDGTYKCSPFHVRFGKLGVLRSKEKLVDIEINGEIRDIHMKLGESGEAFFVEGVYEDDSIGVPDHLATSPITISEFPLPFPAEEDVPKPRRNSIDFTEKLQNQVSDYSHRRYTDGEGHQKREFSAPKREYTTQQLREQEVLKADGWVGEDKETGIFPIDDLEISTTPKTFKAEEITDNSKEDHCRKISILNNDFKPIDDSQENATEENVDQKVEDGSSKNEENEKVSNKKKRRKKSVMKKKNAQRKNSNSSSGGSHSDAVETEATPTDTSAQTTISSPNEEINSSGEVKDDPIESTIRHRDPDIHFFSDTEVGLAQSPLGSRPCTPVQSDTEFEVSQRQLKSEEDPTLKSTDSVQQSWKWGELPSPRPKIAAAMSEQITPEDEKKLNEEAKQAERNTMLSGMFSFMKQNKRLRSKTPIEGLYLADLSSEDMDPEVAALYFPSAQIHRKQHEDEGAREEDCESGNGASLTQSPSSVEGTCSGPKSLDYDFDDKHPDKHNDEVQLSMCGGLEARGPTEEEFQQNKLSYSDVCREPQLLSNPRLVVKLSGKYLSWKAACPIVMTQVVFQQPLPKSAIDQLCSDESIKSVNDKTGQVEDSSKQAGAGGRSWWYWRRSSDKTPSQKESEDLKAPEPPGHTFPETKVGESSEQNAEASASNNAAGSQGVLSETGLSQSLDNAQHKEDGYSGSQSSEESDVETARPNRPMPEKYRKTLRLSSEQIESLNLNEGMNEVVFSVTTAYQGTTRCKCYMYCWKYDDKVVISDIDGTITRSDVLGHILPIVGKDWAQSGVAQLFTKIKNNGYKLLYLSSRAIGQARVTREYLKSIKQNDLSLPDGPLLLNPTSLLSAFHREVIEKKPEQFKISCLSDIQALFPSDSKPFYAGYGNRINDVWAYRAVGIPIVRIFTINHRGELKHEQTHTFQSSYSNMSFIVDQLFPPLLEDASEFSHFVYWRIPLPDVPLLTLGEPPAVSTPTKTSGGTSPLPTIHENTITQ